MNPDIKQTYAYQNLDKSRNEIHLVTIYPGNHDDPLEIALNHVSLDPLPPQPPPQTLSLEKLQATLPPGWTVHQKIEERTLFEGPDKTTTWVHPNPHVSPTACDITLNPFHDIEKGADYEALSYTWGSPYLSDTLMVHSGSLSGANPHPSILRIRPNLSEVLRYLRLRNQVRVVWVDALCINQDDLEEREHQVTRMANIYSRACKVIAWLGPDYDDAVKALQSLQYVGEQIEATNNYYIAHSPGASESTWPDAKKLLPWDDSFWAAVIDLVRRPWFSRVWVIQEIHMGNVNSFLKCGCTEILWSLFQRTVRCLTMKGAEFITRSHIGRPNTMCSLTPGRNFDFFLSIISHHNYCFDPRDFIHGILSLAPAELQQALRVGYGSDTQSVYKDFFLSYTSLQTRSDLLTFAGWPVAATEPTGISRPWPSWVPDWRSEILALQGLLFSVVSASGQSCSEISLGAESHNSLRIKGVLLDETISTLLMKDIGDLAEVLEKFTTIAGKNTPKETMLESDRCQIETVYRYIDAMHQGLTADRLFYPPAWVQAREKLRRDVFQNQDFSLKSDESLPSWWSNYKSSVDYWWPGTKLFLTSRGHPGICKWEVQSGMILYGTDCVTSPELTEVYQAKLSLYLLDVCLPSLFAQRVLGEIRSKWSDKFTWMA